MSNIISLAIADKDKTRKDIGCTTCYHWCAEFVSRIITNSDIHNDAKAVISNSCTQMQAKMKNSKWWSEPDDDIKAGDIIFYNWEHDYDASGNLDHVGIVIEVYTDKIITIEGNTEANLYGDMTSHVREKTRSRSDLNFNCTYPDYYMRYNPIGTPVHHTTANITPTTEYIIPDKLKAVISDLRRIADDLEKIK